MKEADALAGREFRVGHAVCVDAKSLLTARITAQLVQGIDRLGLHPGLGCPWLSALPDGWALRDH
jgi:hypothetical protein